MRLGRRRIRADWLLLVGGLLIVSIWILSGRYSFRRVWFHEFMNRSVRVEHGVIEVPTVDGHLWNRESTLAPDALTDLPPFGEPLTTNEWTTPDGGWHWAGTLFGYTQMGGRTLTELATVNFAKASSRGTTKFAMVLWPGKRAAVIGKGCCLACWYDLGGLAGAACPECGSIKGGR